MAVSTTNSRLLSISGPRGHLHADGFALLAGAILAYALIGGRWWLFGALILAPDLFMLGYLAGPKVGSVVYNAGHSLLVPAVLVAVASLSSNGLLLEVGIIWAAHIGMDHVFGYGFKYATRFKDTHFARV